MKVEQPIEKIARLNVELVSAVKAAIEQALAQDYFDQKTSPLGSRLHCRLIRSGEIVGYKAGRKLLASKSDVRAWLEAHRVAPTEPAFGTEDEDEAALRQIGMVA